VTSDPRTDRRVLRDEQYATDANLAARQSIWAHRHPPADLYAWALDLVGLHGDETVVDVGCGNGGYLAALERRGHRGAVLGLDLSAGMAAAARARSSRASVAVGDAQALPITTAAADVVLSMHMLYHVPDRAVAIAELRRVARVGGVVLVMTNGAGHLRELDELITAAARDALGVERTAWIKVLFTLDDGPRELGAGFDRVERHELPGELRVPDPQLVVDYVASMVASSAFLPDEAERASLLDAVSRRATDSIAADGCFLARAEVGCFVCR
jgi:SAM-dependent methyltransferase